MEARGRKRHIIGVTEISDMGDTVKVVRKDNAGLMTVETKQNGCEVVDNKVLEKKNKQFKRNDSGYSSSSDIEDEDDVIHPCDVNVECQNEPPVSVQEYDGWWKASTSDAERGPRFLSLRNLWNVGQSFCCVTDQKLSFVTRKPVFGVCDQVILKRGCSATETS